MRLQDRELLSSCHEVLGLSSNSYKNERDSSYYGVELEKPFEVLGCLKKTLFSNGPSCLMGRYELVFFYSAKSGWLIRHLCGWKKRDSSRA